MLRFESYGCDGKGWICGTTEDDGYDSIDWICGTTIGDGYDSSGWICDMIEDVGMGASGCRYPLGFGFTLPSIYDSDSPKITYTNESVANLRSYLFRISPQKVKVMGWSIF